MRFGTLRLRHGAPVYFVGFSAQGKELVTASQDGYLACRGPVNTAGNRGLQR